MCLVSLIIPPNAPEKYLVDKLWKIQTLDPVIRYCSQYNAKQKTEGTSKTEIKSQTYQHFEPINSCLKTSAMNSQPRCNWNQQSMFENKENIPKYFQDQFSWLNGLAITQAMENCHIVKITNQFLSGPFLLTDEFASSWQSREEVFTDLTAVVRKLCAN